MFKTPKTDSIKEKIIRKEKERAKANLLSPRQIKQVIENNKDIDFLASEFKEEMNNPDIAYLTKKLKPKIKRSKKRKEIDAEKIIEGSIIGDIIGSCYEFVGHDYNAELMEEIPSPKSFYTDDTVLSIATMKAIEENKKTPNFAKHYLNAYHKFPNAGYGASFAFWAFSGEEDNSHGYHSIGNGCAMRVSFIPAIYDNINDVIKHTIQSVMVTHDHIESIKNTVVLSVCIWMALHNYSKDEIMEYCKKMYPIEDLSMLYYGNFQYDIRMNTDNITNDLTQDSIYVNYAVPVAIRYFYESESYLDCMKKILSHFGDTDTICAISGALCVAYYGSTKLNVEKIYRFYNVNSVFESL